MTRSLRNCAFGELWNCLDVINGEEDVKAGLLGKVQELAVLFAGKAGLRYRYAFMVAETLADVPRNALVDQYGHPICASREFFALLRAATAISRVTVGN